MKYLNLRNLSFLIIILSVFSSNSSCKGQSAEIADNHPLLKAKNSEKFPNSDNSLILVINRKSKTGDPSFYMDYLVYKNDSKKIIKEGSYRGQNIEWYSLNSLKLIPYVGMVKKREFGEKDDASNRKYEIVKLKN